MAQAKADSRKTRHALQVRRTIGKTVASLLARSFGGINRFKAAMKAESAADLAAKATLKQRHRALSSLSKLQKATWMLE